jgi:hypothetical protein
MALFWWHPKDLSKSWMPGSSPGMTAESAITPYPSRFAARPRTCEVGPMVRDGVEPVIGPAFGRAHSRLLAMRPEEIFHAAFAFSRGIFLISSPSSRSACQVS